MIYRALILILILMACGAMPALCEGLNDIHYHIISSLDHAQMTLAEHVRVSFHADSLSTDSLLFWRAMIEKSCEMSIDSIFINNMRLDPLLEDHYMYMYSSNDDSSDQENDLDSLTYTLPMNDVVEGNVNTADFYYTIKYVGPSGVDEIFIPEAFTYGEYYPRLVHSADSISNHDQRYASFETFSFKLRMPRGLYFMSETEPNIAQFGNDAIEISIDSLRTAIFVWSAFPEKYYRHTSIGPVLFDIYIDPALELKEEELQDIADAMAFYGKQFSGIPYEKINVIFIALPGIIAGGAANNFIILPNGSNSSSFIEKIFDDINIFQTVLPHETAHLWWGCAVSITDTWLSEGLASYWADQYAVCVKGQAAYSTLHYDLGRIMYRVQPLMENRTRKSNDDMVSHYYKAPYIVNMLALQMDSNNFTDACREFYREYRNKSPGIEEFKEITQKHSETPLDSFFTCWIDSNYSQNYFIDHVESNRVDTLYHNSIDLGKTGKASSCVPVAIRYKDKTEESFLLRPNQLSHTWKSQSRLASVFIDPDKLILETQRSDNAQPTPIKFHSPSSRFSNNIKLATSFMGDEPAYNIYLLPEFPVYSERFGWDFSAVLLGKGPSFLDDYFMDDVDIVRIGYNTRDNDLIYRLFLGKNISSRANWRTTGNLSINRMRGKYDFGAGIKYGRTLAGLPFFFPALKASASVAHRRYYPLEGVDDEIWPERETTPVKLQISWESYVSTNFELEWGLKASQDDKEYYRYSMTLESKRKYFHGRAFIGVSGDEAVQEKFDPSYEGGMKSYPSFQYYYKELTAINLLLKHSLVSFINLRVFGNHINLMIDGHSASEAGLGLMFGNEMAGLTVDMPAYVSDTDIDGKQWNASRFRVQLHLVSYKGIPKWDFLIK